MAGSHAQTAEVAARYAAALFDLARDAGALDAVADGLNAFVALIDVSDDLKNLIDSPAFDVAAKAAGVGAVAEKAGVHDLARRFLGVMAANGRASDVAAAASAFGRKVAAHKGLVTAEVATAHPLRDEQRAALSDALKAAMGRDVELETTVEPALLGGLRVKVGSRLFDASLATKLEGLKHAMKGA